jgi:hypothetical protein
MHTQNQSTGTIQSVYKASITGLISKENLYFPTFETHKYMTAHFPGLVQALQ